MKMTKLSFMKSYLIALAAFAVLNTPANAGSISDYLEKKEVETKIRESIANLDVQFDSTIGDIDLIDGVNTAARYKYNVEASYKDQYYTRIDKWDVNTRINVGDLAKNIIDIPFSFSVNRESSFVFVRQFKNKKEALKALPYTPAKLPLSAESALRKLDIGDFVSIPANLNIAVDARASTALIAPVVVAANIGVYYILSGEFIIQVFKIDESKVRLKIISKRGYDRGVSAGAGMSFKFFGIKIVDDLVERMYDRDLANLGFAINPGAQFIVDYIFDLSNKDAQEAYNQILKSTMKFKDLLVINKLNGASELKDKMISTFEKAEALFQADKNKEIKNRRVSRIFKGFNDYTNDVKRLKFSLLFTSYNKDNTYSENKITFIDKHESNLDFYYPTYSKYIETKFGKWFFDYKDQTFQNNYGLISRTRDENGKLKSPDYGLTFERKDKYLKALEQRSIEKFMINQIPDSVGRLVDISEWREMADKTDSRIYFQLILKSQGFKYLKDFTQTEIKEKLFAFVAEKEKLRILNGNDSSWEKLKNFLFINRFIKEERLGQLAIKIFNILANPEQDAEKMLSKLVNLNDSGIFDKIGSGFLISLLPQDQLEDLIYFRLEMTAMGLKPIKTEFGTQNYKALYKELENVQSRISNRSFDLRVTENDIEMEDREVEGIPEASVEEFLGLNEAI